MLHIIYENEVGKVNIYGNNGPAHGLICDKITGLGIPKREYNCAGYALEAGQFELNRKDSARVITISFDAYVNQRQFDEYMKIFYYDGWIKFDFLGKKRKIRAKLNDFSDLEKVAGNGKDAVNKIVLQFVCDCPYFEDWDMTKVVISDRTDNIPNAENNSFILPMIFTTRLNEVFIKNTGDFEIMPIFYLRTSLISGNSTSKGFLIENLTTGGFLEIKCPFSDGELITVDTSKRTAVSSVNGSLLQYLTDDSLFHSIMMPKGMNSIKITNFDAINYDLVAEMEYTNRYMECVYIC